MLLHVISTSHKEWYEQVLLAEIVRGRSFRGYLIYFHVAFVHRRVFHLARSTNTLSRGFGSNLAAVWRSAARLASDSCSHSPCYRLNGRPHMALLNSKRAEQDWPNRFLFTWHYYARVIADAIVHCYNHYAIDTYCVRRVESAFSS